MWAGGKTKLLKHYAPIWPDMTQYDHYMEPFLGGGAVYGSLAASFPHTKTINDSNEEMVSIYEAVKTDPETFMNEARVHLEDVLQHTDKADRKAAYYVQREAYWADPTPGKLYTLMRLGFNGIWQTNKASNGLFATPAGLLNQTELTQVLDPALIQAWHEALQTTNIEAGSYSRLAVPDSGRALIYLDPPYRDSFTSYGTGFNDDDQRKLVAWVHTAAEKGHTVLLANRHVEGDPFFETLLPDATFHYFDVVYTAGRRKKVADGYEAKPAREFLAIINP